ncbi:MAG: acetamidase/formamidase family protein [Symbiobacteriaceae bacterium]|nr:acetamidase/formamidase family protein [Symbiobacteriaceae bacterium]
MKRVTKDKYVYQFNSEATPVLQVEPGELVLLETQDALGGQIVDENSSLAAIDWNAVNPATGPVYINGAAPGDTLKVIIHEITVAPQGAVMALNGSGFFGTRIEGSHFKLARIGKTHAQVGDISYPLNIMIGVMGVAPAGAPSNTGTPGSHGGNMDNRKIQAGTTLYLPVYHPGALFAVGDLHAVMADGEVSVTGIEVAGEITLSFELLKGVTLANPIGEDATHLYFIASGATLDEAAALALNDAAAFLQERLNFTLQDAAMLLSLCGNLEVCQIVDPLLTMRVAVAKEQLQQAGFKGV